MGSGDNSRQNEARIFEIRQKLSEQEQKISFCSSNFRQILTIRMSIWRELSDKSIPAFEIRIGPA